MSCICRVTNLKFIHLAGDNTFFAKKVSLNQLTTNVNSDLKKVYTRLCANCSKLSYTVFTNETIELLRNQNINETSLSFSTETKFLGITIDIKLSLSNHISSL